GRSSTGDHPLRELLFFVSFSDIVFAKFVLTADRPSEYSHRKKYGYSLFARLLIWSDEEGFSNAVEVPSNSCHRLPFGPLPRRHTTGGCFGSGHCSHCRSCSL